LKSKDFQLNIVLNPPLYGMHGDCRPPGQVGEETKEGDKAQTYSLETGRGLIIAKPIGIKSVRENVDDGIQTHQLDMKNIGDW
jgi:hypothetical protein